MKLQKALSIFIISISTVFSAQAGQPDTENQPVYYIEEDINSEVEALFNVTGQELVANAKDYLGRPYRRGCMGPYAFDCSGFTSFVYKNMHISLGRSSRDQWKQGLAIDKDNVHVGDLVFFGSSRSSIGHVGIVCEVSGEGDFKFIHSSTSQGVTISSIDDGYYARRYRGARRILEN